MEERRQPLERGQFLFDILVPVMDGANAGEDVPEDPLGHVTGDAGTGHERQRGAAEVMMGPGRRPSGFMIVAAATRSAKPGRLPSRTSTRPVAGALILSTNFWVRFLVGMVQPP